MQVPRTCIACQLALYRFARYKCIPLHSRRGLLGEVAVFRIKFSISNSIFAMVSIKGAVNIGDIVDGSGWQPTKDAVNIGDRVGVRAAAAH